jgi:serine/threonine protein kinase
MPLETGARLGRHEILGLLGAGGMGEVYRARDTRLGRDVAIKTLPDALVADPERVARFEREAQLLAALNHPHIAGIYGLEDVGSSRVLVLEFVDGESLAQRLTSGRIPVDETLGIARQIVDALEAAHEKGIVHRDLKPANIMLTGDGRVKVLDFGLAKLEPHGSGESVAPGALTHSPTLTFAATQAGVILGTAAYMSPEQAKGRAADKRTDVWAFGCVLFEMLTGKRAFDGEDVSDTLAAVLRGEPDWNAFPSDVPPACARSSGSVWCAIGGRASPTSPSHASCSISRRQILRRPHNRRRPAIEHRGPRESGKLQQGCCC